MREIYCSRWDETVTQAHDRYVWSEPVPNGKVLHVKNCYAYAPDRAANDRTQLGIQNGATKVLVRSRKWNVAGDGVSALNDFFVGEYDKIYAYFPDADSTDVISLHVTGVLMNRDEFRDV